VEQIYDAHNMALKPNGVRAVSTLWFASGYAIYYFYSLYVPYTPLYFGLSCFSTGLFGVMLLNSYLS
jgi:hypothetical protein